MTTDLIHAPPREIAAAFKASGMFPDLQSEAAAYVKVIAGAEMGIGPMAAMSGINIIQGKPTLSANLLAAQVKRHPRYDYRVIDHSDSVCRIEFRQDGEPIGVSEFTTEDAQRAGVGGGQNWRKYPQAMLFARALTQGVRWYCPDVTAGPAYVPEELGEPEVVEAEPIADEDIPPAEVLEEMEAEFRPIDELGSLITQADLSEDETTAIRQWVAPEGTLDEERVDGAIDLMNTGNLAELLRTVA